MNKPADTLSRRLAAFATGFRYSDIPLPAIHEAKRRVIDSIGCALAAYDSPPVKAAIAAMPMLKDGSAVIGANAVTTPEWAAFVNGVMIRFLDFNDTYLSKEPAHPSDNIASVLAVMNGRSGKDFITAIVAAYEVQCALCDAAPLRAQGWDHVTYGAISSTVSSAMLLGLSEDETFQAINIAVTTAPALRQTRAGTLSMWKGCAFANAARNAVFCALLAKNGMTGPSPAFEGEFGFFKLVSGEFKFPEPLLRPKERGPRILDTYIKYYPAEYHSQSAINAAIDLSGQIDDVEEIESVRIRTFRAAYEIIGSGPEKRRPTTRETADHSLFFCVATAILDANVTVESFSSERLSDERLIRLMDKIKIEVDGALDRLYPEAMPANIEVRLKSGQTLSGEVIYPKGHPKNPLTDLEVEEKFARLSSWCLTDVEIKKALGRLWALDEISDMAGFFELFNKAGHKHGKAKKLKKPD